LIVGLLLVWGAAFGAIFSTYAALGDSMLDDAVLVYGSMLMNQILGTYIIQMMGMYMLSTAVLWSRTGSMPRWLTIITIILALFLVFILFTGWIAGGNFIFPAWVFFISVYILITNFRHSADQEDAKEQFLGQ
jgi:hypothetical protein